MVRRGVIRRIGMFSFALKMLAIWTVILGGGLQLKVILAQAGPQAATIRHIAVTGDDQDLGVEITATKSITPLTQTLTDPDRLIVDLPEAKPDARLQKILINRGKLKDVRVGLLSANPPVTRVVLDLTAATEYRASTLANKIIVKLGGESGDATAPIVATTNSPAEAASAESTSEAQTPAPTQPTESNPVRWILPILTITAVMAMLVISVVVYLQNRGGHRGL